MSNNNRRAFVHLASASLRAGRTVDDAINDARAVLREADSEYGKEQQEPTIFEQVRELFEKAVSDPTFARIFAGIPSTEPPPETRGTVDTEQPSGDESHAGAFETQRKKTGMPRWK